MKDEGKGMCRYFGKPETTEKTPVAQRNRAGVTASKESVAIQFPYQDSANRMGPTKKAARAYFAERVFVDSERLYLNRAEPDGKHLQIGHVSGPKGPRSTLTYYDYCESRDGDLLTTSATICSLEDCISREMWEKVLVHMQRNGLGAIRSLGHGCFRVTGFDKL